MNDNKKIKFSIRLKIILIILLIISIIIGFFYFISQKVILESFISLEKDQIETNLKRVDFSFQNAISELNVKLGDWAVWDDSYNFIKDKNEEFIKSNLTNVAFTTLKINTMFFVNKEDEIIFSKMIDLDTEEYIPLDELSSFITKNINLFKFTDLEGSFSGVISLREGNLIFVSRPILTSEGEGPIAGFMLFGKFINKDFLDSINLVTQQTVDIYPYNSSLEIDDLILAKSNLSKEKKYFVNPLDENNIGGYLLLYDVFNNPVSILKIIYDRDIYIEGQKTLSVFSLITVFSMIFFGFIIILFFEFLVISRILKLKKNILNISREETFKSRIKVENDDEFGELAFSINNMLDQIQISKEKEIFSGEKEKMSNEKLKEKLLETSNLNKIMVGREMEMIKLKEEISKLKK